MVGLTDTQYSSSATTCPWPACPPPSPARMIMAIMMRIMRTRMIMTNLPTARHGQEAASTKPMPTLTSSSPMQNGALVAAAVGLLLLQSLSQTRARRKPTSSSPQCHAALPRHLDPRLSQVQHAGISNYWLTYWGMLASDHKRSTADVVGYWIESCISVFPLKLHVLGCSQEILPWCIGCPALDQIWLHYQPPCEVLTRPELYFEPEVACQ